MIKYDFENSVSFWIGLTSHLFETSLNNELAGTGITLRQVQVLACLALHGELPQKDLAMLMRIEPPTLVRILDRMERDAWIERRGSPEDRRRKIVRPAEKVVTKWKKIIECGERIEKQAVKGLSAGQLKNLNKTLLTVRKNLGGQG